MTGQVHSTILDQYKSSMFEDCDNDFSHSSYLLETQLLDAIAQGEEEKALNILKNIHKHERPQLASHPVRSLKNFLIGSCVLFTRAVIRGGVPPEKAFALSDAYIRAIERQDSSQALYKVEHDMLTQFSKTVNKEEKKSYSKIVNRAVTYINDHLSKEINLNIISKHCYVNSSYLSHLFKKEIGISITRYITERRIQEAQYYLLHTSRTISEIALLFKFCNQSYFSAQFKQATGVTPGEFRDRHTT